VLIGVQLAMLGCGFGLTIAPTNAAVIAAAPDDQRGAAAALVMVTRLLGFSVGLSALTAWGLARFNSLRRDLELPSITDPGFQDALRNAQEELTSKAIAETFLATAVVTAIGVGLALAMRRHAPPLEAIDAEPIEAIEPIEPNDTFEQTGAPVQNWLHRHLAIVLGAFALVILGAFACIAALMMKLNDTTDDLNRVEAGSALFASQVTGFQTQLADLAPEVSAGLDEAIAGLETFSASTIDFDVAIDETVAINTEVVIDRDVEVPIKTSLPIRESFDTTIRISGPFGVDIPLDVTVPVDIDVPIDLNVTIPINETVPIDAKVPVKVNVPISVDVSETELAELTDALAAGLRSFQEILSGLAG
jgi:hypothetical protein